MKAAAPPSPWVVQCAAAIAPGGAVLDVAAGAGRHSLWLAERGHRVTAIDRTTDTLKRALLERPQLQVEVVTADLESAPWPLGERAFDAVVVTNYLWRPLLPRLAAAIAPGGIVIYETFAVGNEQHGRPRNPEFLAGPDELHQALGKGMEVLACEQADVCAPRRAVVQRLCGRRPPSGEA